MNERVLDVVLGALVTVLAQKLAGWILKKNGNGVQGQGARSLRAQRELVEITSCVEDLLKRTEDLENCFREMNRKHRGGD